MNLSRRDLLAGAAVSAIVASTPSVALSHPVRIRWQTWQPGVDRPYEWATGDCSAKFFYNSIAGRLHLYPELYWEEIPA